MKKRYPLRKMLPAYVFILITFLLVGIWGSRAITTITENAPLTKRNCVIIDAGHGGVDGGASSYSGALESNINLQISLRLEPLMNLLGIKTQMIRTTDISVYTEGCITIASKKVSDLKNRVKTINGISNALLVSIHQNTFSDSQYSGAQVFYAPTQDSETLAKMLQSAFVRNLNIGSNRQVKKAGGVYLLQNIMCTGVLVECGFLSNPEEDALLQSDAYQKKLCCVIASVSSLYLNSAEPIS